MKVFRDGVLAAEIDDRTKALLAATDEFRTWFDAAEIVGVTAGRVYERDGETFETERVTPAREAGYNTLVLFLLRSGYRVKET